MKSNSKASGANINQIGTSHPGIFIQPKLTINRPGDVHEQEADAMADRVMRMPAPEPTGCSFFAPRPAIQRKCKACEEEEQKIHRKERTPQMPMVGPAFERYVSSLGEGGAALPQSERKFFEPRFNRDFSDVRIHTDSRAAQSAQQIDALAYTIDNNIVFNTGQYQPHTDAGRRLIAHELTHVVQQHAPGNHGIQRSPGSPAGGCGVCYGAPRLAGIVAHNFIQEAFQYFHPSMLTEHYILSVLPEAANFSSGFLDLAILEAVDQIAIGEIKPANAEGLANGLAKLELYQRALEALGMRVRRLDYEPPPVTMEFPTFGRGPSCPPVQALEVLPSVNGVYMYTCEPDYSVIRSLCNCRDSPVRRPTPEPVTEPVRSPAIVPEGSTARDVGTAVAGAAATVGAGYIIYRGIRMLPSLFPPLWPTIPANAAIP